MTIENDQKLKVSLTGLSQEYLRELLHYEPETGLFTWLIPTSNCRNVGDIAGHVDETKGGYVIISLFGQHYYGHVLAWFYMYGEWKRIDHKNTLNSDNTLNNLRPATTQQNNWNQSIRIDNMLGVKGVTRSGNKFVARIFVDGRSIYLGTFKTLGEATNARQDAAKKHFGEFYNG